MKKLLWMVVLAFAAYAGYEHLEHRPFPTQIASSITEAISPAEADALGSADSHAQVRGSGVVARILPDDLDGSRHQRFILRLRSGQTVLVAHNIDLAPRVAPLAVGDTVAYNGEFVWNAKGGVVHWTHRDPSGRHEGGWLKHDGQLFQ